MILWRTVFSAGDLAWVAIISVLSMVLYIAGFVRVHFPLVPTRSDRVIWKSLPLLLAMLTVAWSLWIFSLTFAPSIGTIPDVDPNPRPMISLQEMAAIEDARKDETHLYGRGGILGNVWYLAMNKMMPVVGQDRPMFPTRRPNHNLPLLLEFFFRLSSFMIIVLPLTLLWSRSASGLRLAMLVVLWSTFVYAPVVHAIAGDGWLEELGAIDFSMGLALLASGCSALFGLPRQAESLTRSDSSEHTSAGVLLLWLGMSLHISGYSFHADGRAMIALVNMLIGTSCGLLIWSFCNSFLWKLPFSDNIAPGMLASLAAIAPGAGMMLPQSAMILGCSVIVISNIVFHGASRKMPQDAQRQLFFSQGISSLLGFLGTGFFATTGVAGLRWDGREITGLIQGNSSQLVTQAIGAGAAIVWSAMVTWILTKILIRSEHQAEL